MEIDVAETVVIERPLHEVAGYAGDPSHAPTWQGWTDEAVWHTEPPIRLGSRIELRLRVLGRTFTRTSEVVEYEPDQLSMRTVDGPVPVETTSTWRPVGDRVTHMTLRHHLEPSGPAALLGPLIAVAVRRSTRRDLTELKRRLERA
jgi:uncharacterized membrane protein